MDLTKEFEIDMVVNVPEGETQDSVLDKFVTWVADNGWLCGGTVREITEEGN